MALRHVKQYFLEIEDQYFDMLDNLEELKKLLSEGKIADEDYNTILADVQKIKDNYERVAYIMFLWAKPNKRGKKEVDISASWYKALKFSSKEAILDENGDVLSHIKKLIKEGALNNEK